MNLIKEIRTSNLFIQIYSINPNLVVNEDSSAFESKDDYEIQELVFNSIGAEQVDVYDSGENSEPTNFRSYAIM